LKKEKENAPVEGEEEKQVFMGTPIRNVTSHDSGHNVVRRGSAIN